MEIFELLKQRIRGNKKRIVFPEGLDERVLRAAVALGEESLLTPVVLGDAEQIRKKTVQLQLSDQAFQIIDPMKFDLFDQMTQRLVSLRQGKTSLDQAKEMLHSGNYFGTMLVQMNLADGMVSGAAHSTAETVRPALQLIRTKLGQKRVSGAFVMEKGAKRYVFADCAINLAPTAEQLAEIAYQSARTAEMIGIHPKIALLSFSTKGSAKGEMVEKVQRAVALIHERYPELEADGELQFDAATIPEVAAHKAPNSDVAGHANVFVFPELQSGNIGYKLVQRLGGFTAIGPILQGLNAPVNDLSRGASEQDVYHAGIFTAAQAISQEGENNANVNDHF